MSDTDKDPDVVVIPPRSLAAVIILAAVVGGVVGYLVCHFFEGEPPEDSARQTGQVAAPITAPLHPDTEIG